MAYWHVNCFITALMILSKEKRRSNRIASLNTYAVIKKTIPFGSVRYIAKIIDIAEDGIKLQVPFKANINDCFYVDVGGTHSEPAKAVVRWANSNIAGCEYE